MDWSFLTGRKYINLPEALNALLSAEGILTTDPAYKEKKDYWMGRLIRAIKAKQLLHIDQFPDRPDIPPDTRYRITGDLEAWYKSEKSEKDNGVTIRLKKQRDSLEQQWDLLEKKLSALKRQRILENRSEEWLRLDKAIDDTKTLRDQIEEELKEIENRLTKVDSNAQEAVDQNVDQGPERA